MRPTAARLLIALATVALGTGVPHPHTASAGEAISDPTVEVTVRTPPDEHPTAYPGDPASWTVTRPGRDATLDFRLISVTGTDLVASWTSATLRDVQAGPVATVAVRRQYVQLDPAQEGDPFIVQVRYRRDGGRWTTWRTAVDTWLGMGALRGSPASPGYEELFYTVPYTGARTHRLELQLRLIVRADRAGELAATMRVTA